LFAYGRAGRDGLGNATLTRAGFSLKPFHAPAGEVDHEAAHFLSFGTPKSWPDAMDEKAATAIKQATTLKNA
jgi:hypothetical protein